MNGGNDATLATLNGRLPVHRFLFATHDERGLLLFLVSENQMSVISKLTFSKQNRYVYAMMLVAALLLYVFVGNGPTGNIVGKWHSSDVPGAHWKYRTEMIFSPDGTGVTTIHLPTGPVSEKTKYAIRNGILTQRVVSSNIPPEVAAQMVPDVAADVSVYHDKLAGDTLALIRGNETGYILLREKDGVSQ